jgi:hypothetical protein
MAQIVYVLTNEAMPGLVKVGLTTDTVEARISHLSSHSGVPLPFECYFAAEVQDCSRIEKILHQLFAEFRVNPKREFFRVDPEKVVLAISIGDFKEVTPGSVDIDTEEQQALEKVRARRPNLKLEAVGIKTGAILTFSRDEEITAEVAPEGKLLLNGELLSPSAAALKVLHQLGYRCPTANGSAYWMFDGELLDERRRRLEAEQFEERASN